MVKGPLNPNITSLTGELIGNLKKLIYQRYKGEDLKKKKRTKNENCGDKNVARAQTDTHRVTTEGTFQGFRIFFLLPVTKDGLNMLMKIIILYIMYLLTCPWRCPKHCCQMMID